jgi:hypothetical protein
LRVKGGAAASLRRWRFVDAAEIEALTQRGLSRES